MLSAAPEPGSRQPVRPAPLRRAAAVLALAGVALGFTAGLGACSSPTPSRDELVDALVISGLPKSEAECASDAIVDTLSDDEIASIVERGGGGAPRDDPKDTNDTMDKVRAALLVCRDQAAATSTTTSTTTPAGATTSTTVPATSTTVP